MVFFHKCVYALLKTFKIISSLYLLIPTSHVWLQHKPTSEQHLSTQLIYQPAAAVTDDRKYMKSLKEDLWKLVIFLPFCGKFSWTEY